MADLKCTSHILYWVSGQPHRKWRETKQQLIWLPDLALLGCSLLSLHFLCGILTTHPVQSPDRQWCSSLIKITHQHVKHNPQEPKRLSPPIRSVHFCTVGFSTTQLHSNRNSLFLSLSKMPIFSIPASSTHPSPWVTYLLTSVTKPQWDVNQHKKGRKGELTVASLSGSSAYCAYRVGK